MIRFTTAGESHGKALVAIVDGIPAGMPLLASDIDTQLRRRMFGYGRGARMKIEEDAAEILSGVRAGETLGSPIALLIPNKDWENWTDIMAAEPLEGDSEGRRRKVLRPRPGHADLVGVLKYGRKDARDVLERASARETAARVGCGAVCRKLLGELGVAVGSHVVEIGSIRSDVQSLPDDINSAADESPVRCLDPEASSAMVSLIDDAKKKGDTLGGIAEVVVTGLMVGLGSYVSWDRRLDGRLAQALMSIHGVKGVEIGLGFEGARKHGSEVHDEIERGGEPRMGGFNRPTNRAGGLEGGVTNGQPLVLRAAMKPISTLMRPLNTVNLATGEVAKAQSERSDVTAVPAMGVIAEAMAAFIIADALLEKVGGDNMVDIKTNIASYIARLNSGSVGAETVE